MDSNFLYVLCLTAPSYLNLCDPVDCSLPGSSVLGDSPGKNTGEVVLPSSRGSQPRDRIQISHIEVESLPSESPGKPKNNGVSSLSLLHGIFPTRNRTCITGKPNFLYSSLIIKLRYFSPQNFVEDKRAYHLAVIMYIIMLIILQCTLGILKYTRGTK